MPYSEYRGKSVGRLLFFLHKICGLSVAERVIVGDYKVEYYGKVIATYEWVNDGDYVWPSFKFVGAYHKYNDEDVWMKRSSMFMGEDLRRELNAKIKERDDLLDRANVLLKADALSEDYFRVNSWKRDLVRIRE